MKNKKSKITKNKIMEKDDLKTIGIGLLAGMVSGFFSSGGGMLLVPFFTHVLKIEDVKGRGTSVFCIFFLVITSSIFYVNKKYVDINLGIKCAIGGIIGAYLGSKILFKLDKKWLRLLFIFFLVYSGIKMII